MQQVLLSTSTLTICHFDWNIGIKWKLILEQLLSYTVVQFIMDQATANYRSELKMNRWETTNNYISCLSRQWQLIVDSINQLNRQLLLTIQNIAINSKNNIFRFCWYTHITHQNSKKPVNDTSTIFKLYL